MKTQTMQNESWWQKGWGRIKRWRWDLILEAIIIIAWACFVGRDYLNFQSSYYIGGGELEMSSQSHYFWSNLLRCGTCAFWNGSINGGNPAFIELHGMPLHPLVSLSTLLFGGINGSKLVMIGMLIMAGMASWWLGLVIKLGRFSRVWAGALAVAGGHLAGKFANGGMSIIFSIAAVSLVLPPLVDLFWNRNRKAVVWLALALAGAWVAGHSYTQIVLFITWILAALVLFFGEKIAGRSFFLRVLQAVGISILLAGVLFVPLAHFLPNFAKYADETLGIYQSLGYAPLNLVISDLVFLNTDALAKAPFLYVNANYIGWIPILLAMCGLFLVKKEQRKLQGFFWLSVGLVFLVCSHEFSQIMLSISPVFSMLRYLPISTSLAIPPLIGLAGMALDRLTKVEWININFSQGEKTTHRISLFSIALLLIAVISIASAYKFSKQFYYVEELKPPSAELDWLKTDSAEWVGPLGSNWIPPLLDRGQKLVTFRPWDWKSRDLPAVFLALVHNPQNNPIPNVAQRIGEVDLVKDPAAEYASIRAGDQLFPCKATSLGGNIDVSCNSPAPGILVVKENAWSGWSLRVDGKPVALEESNWLQTRGLEGQHTYSFRYQPWDVWVGIALMIGGIVAIIAFLKKGSNSQDKTEDHS
jgi:hypothetical protein